MDLGDPGKWRKSKVESFIRRQLNIFDLGLTRYYEMCMWDNKGNLLPSYAILMDNSIVLTENPPKSIVQTIPLSMIQDISLIADRHSLIKGKNNNSYICQHISIVYESNNGKRATKKPDTISSSSKGETLTETERLTISRPTSSLNINESEDGSNSSHTDLSVTTNSHYYSDVSPSPVPSSIEDTFISSSLLSAYEPTFRLASAQNYAWLKSSPDAMKMNKYEQVLLTKNGASGKHYPFYPYNSDQQRKKRLKELDTNETAYGDESSSSLVFSRKWQRENGRKNGQRRPMSHHPMSEELHNSSVNGRKRGSERSFLSKPPVDVSKSDESEALEQRLNQKNKENNDQEKGTRKTATKTLLQDLHLYFYQRDSEFLNELSLVWNRQQVKNTERQEKDSLGVSNKIMVVNRSLRAAEKMITRVAQDWHYNEDVQPLKAHRGISKSYGHEDLLRKVAFLHKCLTRYEHLKYLCWKNSVIMAGLINALMACLDEPRYRRRSIDVQELYLEKVAIYVILMDIFRTLFEACSISWFRETEYISGNYDLFYNENFNQWEADIWENKLTIFDVTRKLLTAIIKCPFLPRPSDIPDAHGCFLTITDPQKFVKTPWMNLSDENSTKMAKLICTAHNASAALLFELLVIAHFLPPVIEKSLVTYGIKQLNLERYIRLSVTQIINILWSNQDQMTASETMILYRQVWNLRNLESHDPHILHFIKQNFSEEFHYYVHTKGIKTRIPDEYTIKPKVIDVCEKLCNDIVGNPA